MRRGHSYRLKNDHDRAIASFDDAIKVDPNSPAPLRDGLRSGWPRQNYDKAIRDYGELIRINANNGDAYAGRGFAHAHTSRDYDRAIADYDQAISLIRATRRR